jgi:AP-1-like factor
LKDLETKVQDLEKASESANHENIILRAKVEKMAAELKEYRKRLASQASNNRISSGSGGMPSYLAGKGLHNIISNPNDVNFSFEFPKFGKLPGPPILRNPPANLNKTASPPAPPSRSASLGTSVISPTDQQSPHSAKLSSATPDQNVHDMSQFSGLFSPPTTGATKGNSFDYITAMNEASRSNSDSTTVSASTANNTSHSSPASSNSNHGLSSSCGTSPEPFTQSPPSLKADATLTRIGEEHNDPTIAGEATFCKKLGMACGNPSNPMPKIMSHNSISGNLQTPGFDINGIDWFAQQNNNQFDPQLFGDYREPQDNVLSGGLYDDTFFNEAFALPDFGSPFTLEPAVPPKKDLVSEIDAKLNKDEDVVPADPSDMLTCTTIWLVLSNPKLYSSPKQSN